MDLTLKKFKILLSHEDILLYYRNVCFKNLKKILIWGEQLETVYFRGD